MKCFAIGVLVVEGGIDSLGALKRMSGLSGVGGVVIHIFIQFGAGLRLRVGVRPIGSRIDFKNRSASNGGENED